MNMTPRSDVLRGFSIGSILAGTSRRGLSVALLLTLVFAIATMPARMIAGWLPTQLVLEGFSGTLWQGEVARAHLKLAQGDFVLGRLSWALDPVSLLWMAPTLSLESRWGVQQFSGKVTVLGGDAFSMHELSARVDTSIARKFIPLYIGGSLAADISLLRVDAGQLNEIQGRVTWQNAAWTARSGDVALGTYALDISGERGDIRGEVVTLAGPLTVTGELALLDQRYRVALDLTGPALTNQGLRDALLLMAVPTEQGFDVTFEGAVPAR